MPNVAAYAACKWYNSLWWMPISVLSFDQAEQYEIRDTVWVGWLTEILGYVKV